MIVLWDPEKPICLVLLIPEYQRVPLEILRGFRGHFWRISANPFSYIRFLSCPRMGVGSDGIVLYHRRSLSNVPAFKHTPYVRWGILKRTPE